MLTIASDAKNEFKEEQNIKAEMSIIKYANIF